MRVAKNRRNAILSYLQSHGDTTVHRLAETFDVSLLTIRRDLETLEVQGVQRYHGGARFLEESAISKQQRAQLAIAKVASKRIVEGDILFVNSSSTALLTLSQVNEKNVTVVTNNGKSIYAPIDARIHLVLCGGNISHPKEALTGEFALNNLKKVTATRCILGISGISEEMGLSTPNITEVAVNKSMLKRTQGEKIIVADSSKLGVDSAFTSGELSTIDTLITDDQANGDFVNMLRHIGIEVILVEV